MLKRLYPNLNFPSRLSEEHKTQYVQLPNPTRAKFIGQGNEHESSTVLADKPIPLASALYYFEVYVEEAGADNWIAIGVTYVTVSRSKLPGWGTPFSCGYHGDGRGSPLGSRFSNGDYVGCLVDKCVGYQNSYFSITHTIQFTLNGVAIPKTISFAAPTTPDTMLYPCVGLRSARAVMDVNFGQSDFIFDFHSLLHDVRLEVWREIQQSQCALSSKLHSIMIDFLLVTGRLKSAQVLMNSEKQVMSPYPCEMLTAMSLIAEMKQLLSSSSGIADAKETYFLLCTQFKIVKAVKRDVEHAFSVLSYLNVLLSSSELPKIVAAAKDMGESRRYCTNASLQQLTNQAIALSASNDVDFTVILEIKSKIVMELSRILHTEFLRLPSEPLLATLLKSFTLVIEETATNGIAEIISINDI
ncbi:hypothetical protein RCL1_005679 [Eukaryota sp. TZLM3-RCL]